MLVVGGVAATVEVLVRALSRRGFTDVAVAGSAREAVDRLSGGLPDVILLDLGLSLYDDHLLLRHVRGEPMWSSVPVLMLLGRHTPSTVRSAVHEGATGFLAQPYNGAELISKIERVVRDVPARSAEVHDLLRTDPELGVERNGGGSGPAEPRARGPSPQRGPAGSGEGDERALRAGGVHE